MRIRTILRLYRRSVGVLAFAVAAVPAQSLAQDTEYPFKDLSVIQDVIANANDLAGQLQTTCLPVLCNPPTVNGTDINGVVIAVAVGEIAPSVSVNPGNINAVPNLLNGCQHFLTQFLGNTEYIGPLLNYESCLQTGAPGAVLATLPSPSGTIQYLAGVCTLTTKTSFYNYSWQTGFSGTTDCTVRSFGGFGASLTGQSRFVDAIYGPNPVDGGFESVGPWVSGWGSIVSSGAKAGTVPGLAKVKFQTSITPYVPAYCSGSSSQLCGYHWVVLPDRNPDTSTTPLVQCTQTGDNLGCWMNGLPVTQTIIPKY